MPSSGTFGMVGFYTEQSFLDEMIAPYYEKLSLGEKPRTVEQFAQQLPPLPSNLASNPTYQAMYDYLGKYHQNLPKYRHLLGATSPMRISQNQIREYVAQDNLTGDRVHFNYLAVQKVSIFCTFPNSDVGKIALVDMPGLGDTGVGAEERLIELLGQDVDVVLFVRMPKPAGDDWLKYDIDLYGTAKNALKDRLTIDKWSFMILNRIDPSSGKGDNYQQCQFLEGRLAQTPIKVVEPVIIANCADPQEANAKILDRVLDYLATNIEALDKEYASSCKQELLQLHNQITVELDKAGNAWSQMRATASGSVAEFRRLFKPFWEEITRELLNLLNALRKESDTKIDTIVAEKVNSAIQDCKDDPGIPSIEEIEKMRRKDKGQAAYENVFNIYLNQMRTHLSKKFASIDSGLKQLIEQTKSRVTEVLVESGRLGEITEKRLSEFINLMAEKVPDDQQRLKSGFQILSKFDLSYSVLLQHRIRRELDEITPDKKTLKLEKDPTAEEVLEKLKILHGEVVYKCEQVLQGLLWEPSLAAFGMVEEFVDQVLLSEDVNEEWQDFLEQEKEKVWPEKYNPHNERNQLRTEWLNLVERANSAKRKLLESIQFMN